MLNDLNGLYLKGEWAIPADRISTTYQSNDLTKPTAQQASYSHEFSLPDNLHIRSLLRNAEQLDAAEGIPYTLLPAYLIDGGELIFDGVARLTEFSEGWQVQLLEAKKELFTRLDRSIRTADLSRYDHKWSLETMNKLATATDGACYPLVDYGLLSEGTLPADGLFPAMFVKTIVGQLLKEEDYTLVGSLPDDAQYRAMALPFVESEPTSQDEDWKEARTSIVSWFRPDDDTGSRKIVSSKNFIDRVQEFDIDDQPLNALSQGRLKNYNTSTFEYVCDTTMRVQVQATQIFKVSSVTGTVQALLVIEKNGAGVDNVRFDSGRGYNLLRMRTDQLNIDTTIDCLAGDRLRVRLILNRNTPTGAWHAEVYNNPECARVSFTPKIELATNGNWNTARNLPDVTGLRLLLNIARIYCGTWLVNPRRHEIRLARLSETVDSTDYVDWSTRIDTSQSVGWLPQLDPYGQRNLLKWKENDETKKGADGNMLTIPYGDGLIEVKSEAAEAEVPLFDMDFAASINSTKEIPNYGTPLLIKTRTVTGTGASQSINKQNTTPRLILIHPTRTVAVMATRLAADGETIEQIQVNLKPCWFGTRPISIVGPETAFSLCFSPVAGNRSEPSLIDRHYGGLQWVLRRMRVFTVGMRLRAEDISTLDFTRPIRLKRTSIGGLVISDSVWYLNKISNYGRDGKCTVTLVAC